MTTKLIRCWSGDMPGKLRCERERVALMRGGRWLDGSVATDARVGDLATVHNLSSDVITLVPITRIETMERGVR